MQPAHYSHVPRRAGQQRNLRGNCTSPSRVAKLCARQPGTLAGWLADCAQLGWVRASRASRLASCSHPLDRIGYPISNSQYSIQNLALAEGGQRHSTRPGVIASARHASQWLGHPEPSLGRLEATSTAQGLAARQCELTSLIAAQIRDTTILLYYYSSIV